MEWIQERPGKHIFINDKYVGIVLYEEVNQYKFYIDIQTDNSQRLNFPICVKKEGNSLERVKELAYKTLVVNIKKRLLDYKKVVLEYENLLLELGEEA